MGHWHRTPGPAHKGAGDRLIASESLSGRMSAVLLVSSSRWVVQVEARAARQVGPGKPEPVSRVGRGALGRSWASESVRVLADPDSSS